MQYVVQDGEHDFDTAEWDTAKGEHNFDTPEWGVGEHFYIAKWDGQKVYMTSIQANRTWPKGIRHRMCKPYGTFSPAPLHWVHGQWHFRGYYNSHVSSVISFTGGGNRSTWRNEPLRIELRPQRCEAR